MKLNKKNSVTTILFIGLLIPFILITDIFPFVRFGMFAEPIKKALQTEKFILYSTNNAGERKVFDPELIGINTNTFHYLCRNYYYRNELALFSDRIFTASHYTIQKLDILRTVSAIESKKTDTISIGTFTHYEQKR